MVNTFHGMPPTGGPVHRRWISIACAALLVAGCGSSSGSGTAASDTPSTATATPTVRSSDLQRLPQAPDPSGSPPSSQGVSRDVFLRAVFDDAETLWQEEFRDEI